jgi:hypothetical protein
VLPASGPEPRVIQQYQSTFLVDRHGDIWRVYDGNEIDGGERHMPSVSPCSFRMFIPLARNAAMRVHSFARDSAREVDPVSLQAQLDGSRPN